MYHPEIVICVLVSCLLHVDTTMGQPENETRPIIYGWELPHSSGDIPRLDGADCMDPISQPQYTINEDCPSSLTSLTSCMNRDSYRKHCIAYCEQFLYWFLGPEVPFLNSKCAANADCTFSNAKGISITNGYQFNAGITGTNSDAFKIAFNIGSTYIYTETTTTTQTFSLSKPKNANSSCGYWTFLPFYVSSCGFYVESKILSGNWGTYYFGDSWQRCDSNYDIQFDCTNTTYKDADGNAEGDTIFVLTDCTTNERLQDGQDPRYQYSQTPDLRVDTRDLGDLQSTPLDSIQTCSRGCYCGYNRNITFVPTAFAPYEACERCPDEPCGCYPLLLGDYYRFTLNGRTRFSAEFRDSVSIDSIPLTSTNITILMFYQLIPCNASVGEGAHGTFDISKLKYNLGQNISWHWVADGDKNILQHGYECFADHDNIGSIMNRYTQLGLNKSYFPEFENYNLSIESQDCGGDAFLFGREVIR